VNRAVIRRRGLDIKHAAFTLADPYESALTVTGNVGATPLPSWLGLPHDEMNGLVADAGVD
jgi:hypothetical protein